MTPTNQEGQKFEFTSGELEMAFSVDKVAKQAGKSIWVEAGENVLLTTATADEPREGINYFPLLVDFEENMYAIGKFPGGFFKREGKPSDKAMVMARKVDRAIRPRFPEDCRSDVQVVISPFSADRTLDLGVLALNSASLALHLSEIPYQKPVAAARVAKLDGEYVLNPPLTDLKESEMDLLVSGTADRINMMELGGDQVPEDEVFEGVKLAKEEITRLAGRFDEIRDQIGEPKMDYAKAPKPAEEIKEKAQRFAEENFEPKYPFEDKEDLDGTIDELSAQFEEKITEEYADDEDAEEKLQGLSDAFEDATKKIARRKILEDDLRPDGRDNSDIRPIDVEVDLLPRAHGSGLFTRGQTQVLTSLTLGTTSDQQKVDTMQREDSKRFLHHYNFPPFSVGETRPIRGPGRREIGHGLLVEKIIEPVLPDEDEFPYTVRLVSEVLESNASSSQGSVCASTMALMAGGVNISAPVAGVSIGMVYEDDDNYRVINDIAGYEDFNGDMDFKIAGTPHGLTGIQLDVKIEGITLDIIEDTLERGKECRKQIFREMQDAIEQPREELSLHAPRLVTVQVDPDDIGLIIGPGGETIRDMEEEYECNIDIEDDGTVFIAGVDSEKVEACVEQIEKMTAKIEVGQEFEGEVVKIMPFGAFVNLVGDKDGLLHISKVADYHVDEVEDELSEGDIVPVKVNEIDDQDRINLIRTDIEYSGKQKSRKH